MRSLRFSEYPELISELFLGKTLPNARYIHTCALSFLSTDYSDLVDAAAAIADVSPNEFNVVKFELTHPRISLLEYPSFFDDGFPALAKSWSVDLEAGVATMRCYPLDANPPILHRKETLIPSDHPLWVQFQRLTGTAQEAGLLEDIRGIGRKDAWNARLRRVGLGVSGNELVEIDRVVEEPEEEIARHRTALVRYSLSAPMQQLWKYGYLDGERTVFDYGCGRGDDVRILVNRGINASGWDPHFADGNEKTRADVVNLGFVLNVIEDVQERDTALSGAWNLTDQVLVVAVMLGGRSTYERFRLYRDGVITRRGTFQKYFSQNELRQYITETLEREPIAMSPGIFFVFKDEEEEQRFLAKRQVSRVLVAPLARQTQPRPARRPPNPTKWETNRELIEAFWERCEELGRIPEPEEFERVGALRCLVGTSKTVYRRCAEQFGEERVAGARKTRMADILVYLALNLFEQRHSMKKLPEDVRRDVKAFWGSYTAASTEAESLLFSTGLPAVIFNACRKAADQGYGFLDGQHGLITHRSVVSVLSPELRVYLGCASRIYGDFDQADLIKIHIGSKKVSLMRYDDFEGRAVPLLMERTKIFLREANYDVFLYEGEYEPKPLYLKSRYLPDGFPRRKDQVLFDEKLSAIVELNDSRHGPTIAELMIALNTNGLRIRGFRLQKEHSARPTQISLGATVPIPILDVVPPADSQTGYDSASQLQSQTGPQLRISNKDEVGRVAGMTIIDSIIVVLGKSGRPLSAVEIHQAISKEGLFTFTAKDPKGVISSTIGKHLRSAGPHSIERAGPGTFKAV